MSLGETRVLERLAGSRTCPINLSPMLWSSSRESIAAGTAPGMHPWREELFVLLDRAAANTSRFFTLPPVQVFEVGTHVEISR